MKINFIKINFKSLAIFSLLIGLIYFAFWSRSFTLDNPLILDYDPFFHYRYAKMILENNLNPPKWDILSFFPPGRPFHFEVGWAYTMVFFYNIFSFFSQDVTLMYAAKIAPALMVGLSIIPAYLLGRELSNSWGGLLTGLFAVTAPTFIGVSMAGYCDTDVVVVFYTFLMVFSIFMAIRKKKILYYILSILIVLWFIYNWWFGWYVLLFFTLFIPIFLIFKFLEAIIHEKKLKVDLKSILNDSKNVLVPLIIILVALNVLGTLLGLSNLLTVMGLGLQFLGGGPEAGLVNVSVAELQPLNIFTRGGFQQVASRAGFYPTLIALFGIPLIALYKLIKGIKTSFIEIFLFTWMLITFYLILHGIRFSLLFATAVAASAGYVLGNLISMTEKFKEVIFISTIVGIILFISVMSISEAAQLGLGSGGMQVGSNWVEMLDWLKENADEKAIVSTWWDPGHIIAGYTGLRVHADGAHCGPDECIPYNHDIRIQDMGKTMSTSDEDEAVEILKKYMQITPEQCQEVKQKYPDRVPEEACESASEMYFIASNDLIGKFTWMNYFGGYRAPITSNYDFSRNPGVCCAATPKTEPGQLSCGEFANQGRGVWIWCPWIFSLKDVQQDQEGNPVYVYDYSGLTITLIQKDNRLIPVYNNQFVINHLTFFFEGQQQDQDLSGHNTTLEKIDGLIWLDPSFRSLLYFAPKIRNSVFTRAFFYNGEGLKHFELVFSNPEIKLYKVIF